VNDEIFDVVNERDEVTGQATRQEVHRRGLRHRAVHVLVFNSRGEIFLQKRSMKKDCAPGAWDSSASGHLDSGEEYDACAVRELREELGVTGAIPPRRLFKLDSGPETGFEFCWIYQLEHEGPFELHPEEIECGGWFAPGRVEEWVSGRPDEFAGAFRLIWRRWRESAQVRLNARASLTETGSSSPRPSPPSDGGEGARRAGEEERRKN
jgi:isopentenyldiphosphate isomerase